MLRGVDKDSEEDDYLSSYFAAIKYYRKWCAVIIILLASYIYHKSSNYSAAPMFNSATWHWIVLLSF